jgi:hypothetical protein
MGTTPEDLQALAEEFLSVCADALDTIPTYAPALGGAPERTFVSPGVPVFDWVQPAFDGVGCCDQLAVHVESVSDAPTAPGGLAAGQKKAKITHVTLIATVTRCVPMSINGMAPDPADLEDASAQINADGWALWNHIFNLMLAGEFLTLCTERFFDGMRAIRPSGGCGGWLLTVRAQLDGYEELPGS